jgi:hypothetical protein
VNAVVYLGRRLKMPAFGSQLRLAMDEKWEPNAGHKEANNASLARVAVYCGGALLWLVRCSLSGDTCTNARRLNTHPLNVFFHHRDAILERDHLLVDHVHTPNHPWQVLHHLRRSESVERG